MENCTLLELDRAMPMAFVLQVTEPPHQARSRQNFELPTSQTLSSSGAARCSGKSARRPALLGALNMTLADHSVR
jgi:hypothetical protein